MTHSLGSYPDEKSTCLCRAAVLFFFPPYPWISHIMLYYETAVSGQKAKSLTITRYNPERDCVSSFLDQVDDVRVWLVGDGAAVDGQYSVPHFQLPAAVRRASLDDASYFVRHGHTSISSFFKIHVCLCVYSVCVLQIVCGDVLIYCVDWL